MADIDACTVRVRPGNGWLARFSGVLLVVPHAPEQQDAQVDDLLELCRTAAEQGAQRLLLRRVARHVLAGDEPEQLAFALLAAAADGVTAVMVAGDVDVVVRRDGREPERLSGQESPTWVDRLVRGASGFEVTASGSSGGSFLRRSSLIAGVVPASAVEVVFAAVEAGSGPTADADAAATPEPLPTTAPDTDATPRTEPADGDPTGPPATTAADVLEPVALVGDETGDAGPDEPATSVLPLDPEADEHDTSAGQATAGESPDGAGEMPSVAFVVDLSVPEPREPLPVAASEPGPAVVERAASVVQVHGIACPERHLNDPRGRFCNVCGRSLVHVTNTLVTGPRPSLGVLVLDGAQVYTLDGDYVIGREPERDDAVAAGRLRPLRLQDEQAVASRVHAEIRLVDWDVVLEDRGSANGTYLAPAGSQDWEPLLPHRPVVLQPGSQVKMGDQVLRFETRHYL